MSLLELLADDIEALQVGVGVIELADKVEAHRLLRNCPILPYLLRHARLPLLSDGKDHVPRIALQLFHCGHGHVVHEKLAQDCVVLWRSIFP